MTKNNNEHSLFNSANEILIEILGWFSADLWSVVWIPSMVTEHWSGSVVEEWALITTGMYEGSWLSDSLKSSTSFLLIWD